MIRGGMKASAPWLTVNLMSFITQALKAHQAALRRVIPFQVAAPTAFPLIGFCHLCVRSGLLRASCSVSLPRYTA
jgi:hypothetical protein